MRKKKFPLTFPDIYHEKELQNKTAEFSIKMKEVEEKCELPELNEEFLQKFGKEVKTEEDLDRFIKEELELQKKSEIKIEHHQKLREQLYDILTFEIPEQILEEEVSIKLKQAEQSQQYKDKDKEELKKEIEQEAENQIRYSIFAKKMLDKENIQPDYTAVQQRFQMQCLMMGVNPDDFIQEEFGRKMFMDISTITTEEAVLNFMVDKILE